MRKILPISIIIPTLNRPESLINTIKSIMMFKVIPNQIIIVDQSETEIAFRNSLFLKKIELISVIHKIVEFKSSSKARNVGIELATNNIIIFCDDDIEVYEDTLENIYKIMKRKKIALLAAVDTNKNHNKESFLPYLYFYKNPFKILKGHVSLSMTGHFPFFMRNNFVKTEWAMGFFFIVRKSLIEKFGIGFDEKLSDYAYGEDLDFSMRYINSSNKLKFDSFLCSNIKVKHLVSNEFRIPNEIAIKKFYFARLYLILKNKHKKLRLFHFYFFNFFHLLKYIFQPQIFNLQLKYIFLTFSKFALIKDGKL